MRKKVDTEDYNFFATVQMPNDTVKRVLCRLWRPRRMTDPIRMMFFPTQRQARYHFDRPNPFAIEGRIQGLSGNAIVVRATEAWVDAIPQRSVGKKRYETVFEADPIDLQILETARPENKTRRRVKAYINYVLTPSLSELSPFTMLSYMGDGNVKARTVRRFSFTLRRSRRLTFVKRYHHEKGADEDVTWTELVAKEQRTMSRAEFARVNEKDLDEIDDFLLLVSFAARFRVVCVGIDAYTESGDHFTFYRKNRTVPQASEQELNDSVVDLSDFEPFIRKAYRRFTSSSAGEPDELLRQAVQLVMPGANRTIESDFTRLFTALETLVLWHRRVVGLEFTIENRKDWDELRFDLMEFLKRHRVLKDNKQKRSLVYHKLDEIRRVPFSIAFERFCADFGVDFRDLWPAVGKSGDMSLSEIRNHLVHGSPLKRSQWLALIDAREHLRWTVERMLLAIFGWPVEKSKVRPEWLAKNQTAMINVAASRRAMQELPELPPANVD